MHLIPPSYSLAGSFLLLLLAACTTTPLPELPAEDVPASWQNGVVADDTWPETDWWNSFASEELRSVIALVEEKNLDLANNERNLRLAQLALRDAGFDLLPTPVVEIGGAASYSGSEPPNSDFSDSGSESSNLTFGFVYADILSKPARFDAAQARYDLSIAFIADTRLNTLGTAASTYFRILLLRDRIAAAEQNLKNAEAIARIVEARVNAGTVNKIDLLQQQIAVQRQRNEMNSLLQDELAARAGLALLVADSVQRFNVAASTLDDVLVPAVQPGLPSSLLTRRPDIAQAEASLRLSRANVDLARSAYLPNITLTGSAGLRADSFDGLFSDATTTVSATGIVAQLLLDNGARGRNVEASRLELESALASYRETVIAAFNDIEVSLGNIELLAALGEVAIRDLARAEEAFRISEVRYREGIATFQEVLVSQSALFNARNAMFDNKLAQLNAIIAFYQSLGGGWLSSPTPGWNSMWQPSQGEYNASPAAKMASMSRASMAAFAASAAAIEASANACQRGSAAHAASLGPAVPRFASSNAAIVASAASMNTCHSASVCGLSMPHSVSVAGVTTVTMSSMMVGSCPLTSAADA